jgi:transposase-like protein
MALPKIQPRHRGPGRRTLLTPAVQSRILEAIRQGAFAWVAAASAGISPSTFFEWLRRGEGTDPDRPSTAEFAAFAAEVRQAEAEARLAAEIAVRQQNPLAWLRCGPGRTTSDRPGWTDTQQPPVAGEAGAVRHVIQWVDRTAADER